MVTTTNTTTQAQPKRVVHHQHQHNHTTATNHGHHTQPQPWCGLPGLCVCARWSVIGIMTTLFPPPTTHHQCPIHTEREVWMEQERQWRGEGVVIEWKWLAKTSESQAPQQTHHSSNSHQVIHANPQACYTTTKSHSSATHTHQVAASKKTGVAQGQRATTK